MTTRSLRAPISVAPRPAAFRTRPRPPCSAALACAALLAAAGCTPGGSKPAPPPSPPQAVAPAPGAPADAAGPTKERGSATEDLLRKLKPPGLPEPSGAAPAANGAPDPGTLPAPAEPPLDAASLTREAEQFAETLVASLDSGDPDAILGMIVSEKDLEAILQPGVREIMSGSVISLNQRTLERVSAAIKGKPSISHTLEVGTMAWSGAKSFKARVPTLTDSTLTLSVDGVALKVKLDQLLHLDGAWRVFRVSTP